MSIRRSTAALSLACGLALLVPAAAQAAFEGPSATYGAQAMSVDRVLSLKFDRERVCMTGRIVNKLVTDDDKYTFQDNTGNMVVEIDYHVFGGQTVTPSTNVRVCGEVDAETFRPNEFDVETLQILP